MMMRLGMGFSPSGFVPETDPYPTPLYYRNEDFTAADVTELSPYVTGGTLSLGTADVGGKSNYLILTVSTDDTPVRISIPGHSPTILAAPQSQYPAFPIFSRFYLDSTMHIAAANHDGNSSFAHGISNVASDGGIGSGGQGTWFNPGQALILAQQAATIFYNYSYGDSDDADADPKAGDELYISRILIRWALLGQTPEDP